MSKPLVIVVTGANRGIGLAICRILATTSIESGLVLYAASRSGSDLGLKAISSNSVRYATVDISAPDSINALATTVERAEGYADVLINNAGLMLDGSDLETAEDTIAVNFTGTKNMCQAFFPIMRKGGRIVNLSSVASSLVGYNPELQHRLRTSKDSMTLEQLNQLARAYLDSVHLGTSGEDGWPVGRGPYSVSKALVNAMTAILARQRTDLCINACCPGWVSTEMGHMVGRSGKLAGSAPPKSLEEGVRIPLRLAMGEVDGVSGEYWANSSVSSTAEGSVQDW